MSDYVVAYRYAKALMDLAIEQKVVDQVNEDMKFFAEVCEQNKEFTKVMANPIVRHDKKKAILKSLFENKINNVTFSIFNVLTRKNRENLLFPISVEFQKLYADLNKIQQATVSSVVPLNAKQREEFINVVKKATGKTVDLKEKIDESLIGGYILKVGDMQIDTSIRKKINELKLELA